jgi:hypothetical protein
MDTTASKPGAQPASLLPTALIGLAVLAVAVTFAASSWS